jgi:3-oxoacyl-[acyl-carrier protein] reductase
VAVVTGGRTGIGKATAELLVKRGFVTIRLSRTIDETDRNRRCDVNDEHAVTRVFSEVVNRFGRLDVLVNAAGIASVAGPLDLTVEDWTDILRTNVIGTYLCCQHAIPVMQRQRYGKIVNISSIAARGHSETASVAYTASKYAVVGLTRQLAANFGRDGITVNCVCPSQTKTEMLDAVPAERLEQLASRTAAGRLAEPEEVAAAIAFLASDAAGYVNGAVLDVHGGGSCWSRT